MTRCARLHRCDINVDTGSTQCGRGAINTRGRMSAASCSLLLMSGGMLALFTLTAAWSLFHNNQTLTPYQHLLLRALPTRRCSTLDGSTQTPHPYRTPPKSCVAAPAATASHLERPYLNQVSTINQKSIQNIGPSFIAESYTLVRKVDLSCTLEVIRYCT